jgi:hypothetical protein
MSRLADKVRVEPLTPDRLDRVERAVLSAYRATEPPPVRARWGWMRLAVPAAAVCAVALMVWLGVRGRGAGEVAVAPTRVVTPAGDSSRIDLGDAVITVGSDTELAIERRGGGIHVVLDRGTVDCEVEPRGERPPFVVHAAEVDVTVVGTLFQVARDGDDVRVEVTRGKVRVDAAGGTRLVAAGQAWHRGEVKLAAADEPAPEPAVDQPRVATAGPDDEPGRVDPAAESRDEIAEPAPAERRAPRRVTRRVPPRKVVPKPAPNQAEAFAGAPAPVLARPGVNGPGPRADRYRKAHDAFFRQHDPRQALLHIDHFFRQFTKGDYTDDVLKLRIRILCTEPSSACRKAAHTFLRLYPGDDYASHARALTNWM